MRIRFNKPFHSHCTRQTAGAASGTLLVLLLLFSGSTAAPGAAPLEAWFWNLDAREAALAGAVTARPGSSYLLNRNPASLPVREKPGKNVRQQLNFANALRMTTMLLGKAGGLPYDAIDSEEKWEDTKYNVKWLAISLLSLYSFTIQEKGLSLTIDPVKEIPVLTGSSCSGSSIALAAGIPDLISFGLSATFFHLRNSNHYLPFALADRSVAVRQGYGFSAGLLLHFESIKVGLDYHYLPEEVFADFPVLSFPFKDRGLSIGINWLIRPEWDLGFDLVNISNSGREDFFSPRLSLGWRFFKHGQDQGELILGLYRASGKNWLPSAGFLLEGQFEGFHCRAVTAAIFDPKNNANRLFLSMDFIL